MSVQKDVLLRVAAALCAGELDRAAECFAEDFALHDPNAPGWPRGREGARRMLESVCAAVPGLARAEALDVAEAGDLVAVRWRFAGSECGEPRHLTAVAFYRFAGGRIAEDWGIAARADWP